MQNSHYYVPYFTGVFLDIQISCKIHWHNVCLADASCGTNFCPDRMWWDTVHRNTRVTVATSKASAGRLSATRGICSSLRTSQRIPRNVPTSRSQQSTERKIRGFDTLHYSSSTICMSANARNEIATSNAVLFLISLHQHRLGKAHYVLMQCGNWLFISWIRRHGAGQGSRAD